MTPTLLRQKLDIFVQALGWDNCEEFFRTGHPIYLSQNSEHLDPITTFTIYRYADIILACQRNIPESHPCIITWNARKEDYRPSVRITDYDDENIALQFDCVQTPIQELP